MALGVGLELSPSAIRAVLLVRAGGQLKLLAAREVPCKTANPEELTRALLQVRQTLRISQPVVLGLPSTSVILTTVHPLIVTARRAPLAVQFEFQQHLPFALTEAVWHYQWLSSTNGHAIEKRAGSGARGSGPVSRGASPQPRAHSPEQFGGAVVAAMRRSILDERLRCCEQAGLKVHAVALSSVAALNAWYRQRGNQPARAGALLNVVDDQLAEWILWTPTSLEVIPVAVSSPQTFWEELSTSWEGIRSAFAELPTTMWMVGPASAVPQLQAILASASSGVQAEAFDATQVVGFDTARLEHPEHAVAALGLALQGLGAARVPLNLIAEFQRGARFQRVRRAAMTTSGVCAAAIVVLGVRGMMELRHRHLLVLEALQRHERLYQTLRPDIRALLQRQQHTQQRSQQLERLAVQAPIATQFLAQAAEVLPDAVWLTKVECSKSDLLEGTLEGRATSFQLLAQFMDALKSRAGMTTVKLLSNTVITDETSGKELIAFSIQIQHPLGD